jgi:hypothetical protein
LVISAVVHEPLLIHIDRFGKAHWQDQHVAIGSGADVARAMLCLQPWSPISHHQNNDSRGFGRLPIEECIFRIKEAHFAAHKANPSLVGDAVTMQVVMQKYRATLT